MKRYAWILWDGRAESGDTDDAVVLEVFRSRRDLKANLHRHSGEDGVLYEYDATNDEFLTEHELTNGRMLGHLREGKAALLAKCSRITQE